MRACSRVVIVAMMLHAHANLHLGRCLHMHFKASRFRKQGHCPKRRQRAKRVALTMAMRRGALCATRGAEAGMCEAAMCHLQACSPAA